MSLGRCLVRSDVAMLVVAEALVLTHPATPAELDELLGTNDLTSVIGALERLAALGVVVIEGGVARPVGALTDLFLRPLGLGPSFTELATHLSSSTLDDLATRLGAGGARSRAATARAIAQRLRATSGLSAAIADAPLGTAEMLEALIDQRSPTVGLPAGFSYQRLPEDDPLVWLLSHGLLVAIDDHHAELPAEIVIGASSNGLAPTAALRPIALQPVTGLPAETVSASAADRASRTLEATEALLRQIEAGDVATLKAGGIGAREIKRLAKLTGIDDRDVARLLELLFEGRLIVPTGSGVTVTPLAARWWQLSRARRWIVLVRAWLGASVFISQALSRTDEGKLRPALDDHEMLAAAGSARRGLVDLASGLASGEAFDIDQLAEASVWRCPNLWGVGHPPPEHLVDWTVAEAELLGLVAQNAPAPTLAALASDDEARLHELAAAMLGEDQGHVMLQSDLTAVALGPLSPRVAGVLGEMADRITDSAVPQFRFSETSIRRAFDRGWGSEGVVEFLSAHALSGVPQPLSYLIADVERRYGSVRILDTRGVIVTEDEATALEIASSSRAARLGLRIIAPTVLIGPVEPRRLLDELRAEGLFPVIDGVDGCAGGPHAAVRLIDLDAPEPDDLDYDIEFDAESLPADWTGPALDEMALAGEVADAVGILVDDPGEMSGEEPPHGLHLLRNRAAVVTHRRDGQLVEARGVVVAIGDSITLLNESGVEDLPIDSVVAVEDPSR